MKDCRSVNKTRTLRILLVNVEAFGASKKVLQYMDTLYATRLSYLRSMKAQLLKTPRPSGLRLWLNRSGCNVQTHSYRIARYEIAYGSLRAMRIHGQEPVGIRQLLFVPGRYAITRTQRMGSHSFQQIVGYRNLSELSDKLERFLSGLQKKKHDLLMNTPFVRLV